MGTDELVSRLRQQMWQQHSEEQVELLRSLRDELSSRRWKIMLEVDSIRALLYTAQRKQDEREVRELMARVADMLDQVHRDLSRIPEDVIPAF